MKSILFNTEMVQAILDGRKTVTRQVIKPHNPFRSDNYKQGSYGLWIDATTDNGDKCGHVKDYSVSPCWQTFSYYIKNCAPYKVGDILYVRETWIESSFGYVYLASDYSTIEDWVGEEIKWKPSIIMPKEAARIFLKVTNVKMEQLQDMTEDDVCSEGAEKLITSCEHMDYSVVPPEPCFNTCNACKDCIIDYSYPELFGRRIWDATIKKNDFDKYSWKANPWVWVIEFERIESEER